MGLGAFGRVDGFDEDEAESEGNNGTVVLGGLLSWAASPHYASTEFPLNISACSS